MKHYDIIVIGSGGGSKITRPAANLGLKVAIIEEAKLGGTCLNHGCIPSKMLIHPADVATILKNAHRFEVDINDTPKVRFKELVERVSREIDADSDSIAPLYENHKNIDFYPYHASFVSDKVIEVNGESLTADKIFIVTGARPHIPDIPGLKDTPFLTYKEALRLTKQPRKLIVVGAGFIATELGYFFGALGTDVTFLVRSQFLRPEDDDIVDEFTTSFKKRFNVELGASPNHVTYKNKQFTVTYDLAGESKSIEADQLLIVTGVTPNADKLGLENTSITTNDKGYINVDDYMQTAVPGVYSFGDVVGNYLFRHSANFEGQYCFDAHVKGDGSNPIKYPPMPYAVFTQPQIARVGKSEKELKQDGIAYLIGKNAYKHSAMGMALRSKEGFVKLLFDEKTKVLLGAHIIGEEASNMIHMLIAYMNMGATLDDLLSTIYIHPALPEIVRNAARNVK